MLLLPSFRTFLSFKIFSHNFLKKCIVLFFTENNDDATPSRKFVALVTPMFPDGSLDHGSLKNLIEWQIENGTSGIVSVGTTGESATLNVKEHLEVIEKTIEYTKRRVPVIAGTELIQPRKQLN